MTQEDKQDIVRLTETEFNLLRPGTKILIQDKFAVGKDNTWYNCEVTRGTFPNSNVPAIHFRVTDERMRLYDRDQEFLYYFSDAHLVAYDQ